MAAGAGQVLAGGGEAALVNPGIVIAGGAVAAPHVARRRVVALLTAQFAVAVHEDDVWIRYGLSVPVPVPAGAVEVDPEVRYEVLTSRCGR